MCRICLGFMADHTGRLNTMFACTFLAGTIVGFIFMQHVLLTLLFLKRSIYNDCVAIL